MIHASSRGCLDTSSVLYMEEPILAGLVTAEAGCLAVESGGMQYRLRLGQHGHQSCKSPRRNAFSQPRAPSSQAVHIIGYMALYIQQATGGIGQFTAPGKLRQLQPIRYNNHADDLRLQKCRILASTLLPCVNQKTRANCSLSSSFVR